MGKAPWLIAHPGKSRGGAEEWPAWRSAKENERADNYNQQMKIIYELIATSLHGDPFTSIQGAFATLDEARTAKKEWDDDGSNSYIRPRRVGDMEARFILSTPLE